MRLYGAGFIYILVMTCVSCIGYAVCNYTKVICLNEEDVAQDRYTCCNTTQCYPVVKQTCIYNTEWTITLAISALILFTYTCCGMLYFLVRYSYVYELDDNNRNPCPERGEGAYITRDVGGGGGAVDKV